jgi:hypothetical protein
MPEPTDRIAEIRAALAAIPAPPWCWFGDGALTTDHSGKRALLTAHGSTFRFREVGGNGAPILRSAAELRELAGGNPIGDWLVNSAQYAMDLLARIGELTTAPGHYVWEVRSDITGPDLYATEELAHAEAIEMYIAANYATEAAEARARLAFTWLPDEDPDGDGCELAVDGHRIGLFVYEVLVHARTTGQLIAAITAEAGVDA